MKLIIDISDDLYNVIKSDEYGLHKGKMYDIIRNGTPLEDVKAEMKDLAEQYKEHRYANTYISLCIKIIDKHIGKESEEKE